jgi:amino acid permease
MGEQSTGLAIVKAIVTVLLVTAVVAAALGGATYVASRALVGMMS